MWTRKTATNWIQKHQYISTVGDCDGIVMDGDGCDFYEAIAGEGIDLNPNELGKLLAFVFNDYVKVVEKNNNNNIMKKEI